jgi:hypothetical protein
MEKMSATISPKDVIEIFYMRYLFLLEVVIVVIVQQLCC